MIVWRLEREPKSYKGKKIVEETVIGAGSVVVKDIVENGTYIGVPAKQMK